MAITLELKPEIEAQLVRQTQNRGLPLSEYVEELIADLYAKPGRKQDGTEAYLNRVRKVLGKLDELPRLEIQSDRGPMDSAYIEFRFATLSGGLESRLGAR
jgi:hypothetical protein